MLEEYPAPVKRSSLLTTEERMRLTAENRARSIGEEDVPRRQADVDLAERSQQSKRINEPMRTRKNGVPYGQKEKTTSPERDPYPFSLPTYVRGTNAVALEAYVDPLYDEDTELESAAERETNPAADVRSAADTAEWEDEEADADGYVPVRRVRPQAVRGRRFRDFMKPKFHARTASAAKAVLLGSCAMLLVGCVIYGRVQTNEVYSEIADIRAQYDDACAQNVSMQSEMEGKMTVKNVEDYAENVLGLKHLDQSQIEYIQLQTEDEVEIAEPETNFFLRIREEVLAIWESLRGA